MMGFAGVIPAAAEMAGNDASEKESERAFLPRCDLQLIFTDL